MHLPAQDLKEPPTQPGTLALALLLWLTWPATTFAQDVEPRRWTHLPVGVNVLGAGYGYTTGDIGFDPVLLIEDVEVEAHTVLVSYVRSMDWFGKTARVDVLVPYQQARWQGLLDGIFTTVNREGLVDPRIRLSVNLYGAPALKGKEFLEYRASHKTNTTVGIAVAVRVPFGQYKEDKLLNLGQNRFIIRPQVGFVHTRGPWSYELTGSVFFYTDNDEFFDGNKREQDHIYAIQAHVVRTFRPGLWASLSVGYGRGGRSTLNGVDKDDLRSIVLSALSVGFPIGRTQAIKLAYIRERTQVDLGTDADSLALGWSVWF